MKQTKHFLRPLLMAIVMLVGMLMPQGAWAEDLWVDGETITISSDASYDEIEVLEGGFLIINEGVTLTVTSGLNIHDDDTYGFGTVINYGTIIGDGHLGMQGGVLANHGHIELGGSSGNGTFTFYNTGTLGGPINLYHIGCDHDEYDNLGTVEATCTHGAGTQYRCKTCYYMRLDETSGALPHSFDSHNGINICSSCGHTTYDEPANGDGSEEDPYQIANAANLYWFADYTINENNYANAILTADIVLNDGTFATDGTFTATGADEPSKPFPWICIGGAGDSYYGTFDGNGHTISGMYVNDSFGLFYDLYGSVVNLGIVNCYIRDDSGTGAICYWNDGTISNCYTTRILSGSYGYGICNTNVFDSTISNCYSTCSFVNDIFFDGSGICGTNLGTISNCYTSYDTAIQDNAETASEVYGGVSAERFASGEIAYKLNGSVDGEGNWTAGATDGTQAWYQKLGENGDSYPVLAAAEGNTVYYGYENCLSESETYSNDLRFAEKEDAHAYQVLLDEDNNPVFVWSDYYTTATLQLVCSHNEEHTANVEVTGEDITSEDTTPATCTTTGVRTYTATATYKDETYIGIKEVEISATGHDFKDQVIAENQGEDGYYHYGCSRCDELDSNYSFAKMFGAFREVTDDEAPTETIQLTKVGNYYYASLYTDFPYVVGGADVAYYVTSAEDGVVTLGNTANVRAGSGVIFRSENSECTIVYDPEGFENTAPEENLLTGSDEAFVPNANQYAFGLSNEGFLGFWRWPNMTIPAWKAYLELDEETSGARGFRIVFDDETNGIHQLPADASAIDGCYDLMGHKVREVKGLGIVNGKKVFVNY